ncbi:glycosyl hydrolase 115 family protein [Galbibacter orientalis]|uniref:glycosyl hydrolase 115 family protein n=1 Tax=Galbibacter orientalis TaxID=453852 RepID=UPI003080658D
MVKFWLGIIILLISFKGSTQTIERDIVFDIYTQGKLTAVFYDADGNSLDSISANLLADDIARVTGHRPTVKPEKKEIHESAILIGSVTSNFIKKNLQDSPKTEFLAQKESYLLQASKDKKQLIIAGTDARGTAYGVFSISKKLGVNPWYWWADVPVEKKEELKINVQTFYSKEPSVSYRGIFLNDEDWGLQPWAANNFETETKDIGPKTYEQIFELLLRLNANTIWPAMHPSTKAFFYYPRNPEIAKKYHIVVGSSHAEPMLRNNVDEWDKEKMGSFNYKTNKENVYNYWETRVKEAEKMDAIYTIGMRGVHDSGMEGVSSKEEAVAVLNDVINDQRFLIKKYINKEVSAVPQAFTVYKEVLDLYKNGLEIPDDITLVWTDDNYGYIRSLSNAEERKRTGGGGVYYHASYWGRPHDYLWLSTTHPSLIREEMMKAYNLNNKEIWILNVGDIKPAEYNTQLFLDMAYNAEKFRDPSYVEEHQQEFYATIFGADLAKSIGEVQNRYYKLAFERKPEFMGWSQTEPTTSIYQTAYKTLSYGDEVQQRINAYGDIEEKVDLIEGKLPENLKITYFQLVKYPVKASAAINKKFLYRDKSLTYAKQFRKSAHKYKDLSYNSYKDIVELTKTYNQISNGKWNGIMDMKPRRLPVFDKPEIDLSDVYYKQLAGIVVEDTLTTETGIDKLPTFYVNNFASYFIDIYLKAANNAQWKFESLPEWVKVSKSSGKLNEDDLEERVYVTIDWKAWRTAGKPLSEIIKIEMNGREKKIQINVSNKYASIPEDSFTEKNGVAMVYAHSYLKNKASEKIKWNKIEGLGHSGAVMQAESFENLPILNYKEASVLEYEFYTETVTDKATLLITALPTHPLTTNGDVRIAVQWNDDPIEIIDFKTKGRSEAWKQNVLSNKAIKEVEVAIKAFGKQTLKIYSVDAGVCLDYFILKTNTNTVPYKLMSETKNN